MVQLDVLPRRYVTLAQRHVLLDHVRERLHLLRRDAAEGQLHAHHLHVRLALSVDALLEAELDELLFRRLAVDELRRLALEVVELAPQDRDHVPGHMLEYLGVLERSARGGDRNWLHFRSSSSGLAVPVRLRARSWVQAD